MVFAGGIFVDGEALWPHFVVVVVHVFLVGVGVRLSPFSGPCITAPANGSQWSIFSRGLAVASAGCACHSGRVTKNTQTATQDMVNLEYLKTRSEHFRAVIFPGVLQCAAI